MSGTKTKPKPDPKTMPLRRLVVLMLVDLEIYEEDEVDEAAIKAYSWPAKYLGFKFKDALMDCTRILLFGVLAHHCPSTKG